MEMKPGCRQSFNQEGSNEPKDETMCSPRAVHAQWCQTEQGQYDKAAEATGEAIALAQDAVNGYDNLGNFLLALQRFDDARRNIQQAQDRKLDDYVLHLHLYALAFLADNSANQARQTSCFERKRGFENMGLSLESDTEAYAGHLRNARELTRRSVDSALRTDDKESAAIWQSNAALREAAFGSATEARQAASKSLRLSPTSQAVQLQAALAFAMASDTARGESLLQDLAKRFPVNTQVQSIWLPTIRGQLTLPGNPPAAIELLKPAAPLELGQIQFNLNLSCLYPAYVRGEAFLSAGDTNAAASEFQKVLDHTGIVWNCWTGACGASGRGTCERITSDNFASRGCRCCPRKGARRLQRISCSLERRRP
jgi:tetratricopeptide (TPR) repeat protein